MTTAAESAAPAKIVRILDFIIFSRKQLRGFELFPADYPATEQEIPISLGTRPPIAVSAHIFLRRADALGQLLSINRCFHRGGGAARSNHFARKRSQTATNL